MKWKILQKKILSKLKKKEKKKRTEKEKIREPEELNKEETEALRRQRSNTWEEALVSGPRRVRPSPRSVADCT